MHSGLCASCLHRSSAPDRARQRRWRRGGLSAVPLRLPPRALMWLRTRSTRWPVDAWAVLVDGGSQRAGAVGARGRRRALGGCHIPAVCAVSGPPDRGFAGVIASRRAADRGVRCSRVARRAGCASWDYLASSGSLERTGGKAGDRKRGLRTSMSDLLKHVVTRAVATRSVGLLAELDAEGASGSGADAVRVAGVAPEAIVRWVSARLVSLGESATGARVRLRGPWRGRVAVGRRSACWASAIRRGRGDRCAGRRAHLDRRAGV